MAKKFSDRHTIKEDIEQKAISPPWLCWRGCAWSQSYMKHGYALFHVDLNLDFATKNG